MTQLLAEDLIGNVHMRRHFHADGSRWFINHDVCVEYPRLSCERKTMRRTGEVSVLWFVDNHPVGQLEDAVAVLNGDTDHVPIAVQIAAMERLCERNPDAIGALIDPSTSMHELEAVLRTLRWSRENAGELRAYRKWKREQEQAQGNQAAPDGVST